MRPELKTEAELIAHAVRHSGLSNATPSDIDFYISAHRTGILNWRDIRKSGRLMSPQDKRERGLNYRGMFTFELWDTLNEEGRIDPVESAGTICAYATGLIRSYDSLQSAKSAGVDIIRFRASNMAAGPCPKALALNEARLPVSQVEITPFDECTHPGQCACMFQSWIPVLDDLDNPEAPSLPLDQRATGIKGLLRRFLLLPR